MPALKEWISAYAKKPLTVKLRLAATLLAVVFIFLPLFLIGRGLLIAIAPFKALSYFLMWQPYTAKECLLDAFKVQLSFMDVVK